MFAARAAARPPPLLAAARPPRAARRHVACTAAPPESLGPADVLQEWDVVVYTLGNGSGHGVGRVARLEDGEAVLDALSEEAGGLWATAHDAEEVTVPYAAVLARFADANVEYSQRQIDRQLNPHAEHAEEVFKIRGVPDWVRRV
jgi:hypothetical protein